VPEKIDQEVGKLKLASMNIAIDSLTEEQQNYLASWELGT
jgi:adenosylhomocysteinase